MSPRKSRIVYTTLISIVVFIILICNLGSNFKSDIFSYKDTTETISNLNLAWNEANSEEEYSEKASDIILKSLKKSNLSPLRANSTELYTENFTLNVPYYTSKSYIEVISKHDNLIKSYTHNEDFTEDVTGLFSSGYAKGDMGIIHSVDSNENLSSIALFENYSKESIYDTKNYDTKLKALGISTVIYPASNDTLVLNGATDISSATQLDNGIIKFMVSREVFDELVSFYKKGYRIKVRSGLKIKPQTLKNVYGVINGSNPSSKPLIVAAFYDGKLPKRNSSKDSAEFICSTYTPSLLLECAKILQTKQNIVPDRSIIFAFLSGKSLDEIGLKKLKELNINGDLLLLNDIGNSDKFNLSFNKNSKNFSSAITYFLNKNKFEIASNSIDNNLYKNFICVNGINNLYSKLNFSNSYKSCKFILSLLEDECYNLDILTANSREIRNLKRSIKDYTIPLACVSLILITYVVFKFPEIKNIN